MRSARVNRSWRGIRGLGSSRFRSYCSNRFSDRISMTSRKPCVVMKAVRAPWRWISALVTSVVPWITWPMSRAATPAPAQAFSIAAMIAFSGCSCSVSTLAVARPRLCSSATSVKVPPISTPTRIMAQTTPFHIWLAVNATPYSRARRPGIASGSIPVTGSGSWSSGVPVSRSAIARPKIVPVVMPRPL